MFKWINKIPNLTGQVCEALVQQDYWYQGQPSVGVHVVFLKVKDGAWHRFFFDCGVLFWQEVDMIDRWSTTLADEHHYPQHDITSRQSLNGAIIHHMQATDSSTSPTVSITFSNGVCLVVRDFCDYQLLEFSMDERGEPL